MKLWHYKNKMEEKGGKLEIYLQLSYITGIHRGMTATTH